MDALQKVFDTIMDVLGIIKKFFNELFGAVKGDENPDADAGAAE